MYDFSNFKTFDDLSTDVYCKKILTGDFSLIIKQYSLIV